MTGPLASIPSRSPTVEAIAGPQGSGRSRRLADRISTAASDGVPCLLIDPTDYWSSARCTRLPEGTVVIRSRALLRAGGDPAEVISIAMFRLPGSIVGIDDCDVLGLDNRGWARVYAAASTTKCLLLMVLGDSDGAYPGVRFPGPGRLSSLAAHGA